MNERIRKLAEQAEFSVKDLHIQNDNFQRFGELIVQECASMAKAFHSHGYDFTGDLELNEFMLKHFGIEE